MSDEVVPAEELSAMGVIQEVNRLLLHPVGLALAYRTDGRLQVLTDPDPEGWNFQDIDLRPRAKAFADRQAEWHARRYLALGYVVQPVDGSWKP